MMGVPGNVREVAAEVSARALETEAARSVSGSTREP